MLLVRLDTLESFGTVFAMVSERIEVDPIRMCLAVTFLFKLLRAVLAYKPLALVVNADMSCKVFSRPEPLLAVDTAVGLLFEMDHCKREGKEIFLTLRNIFGLILNHVRYDDSRLELCKNLTNSK